MCQMGFSRDSYRTHDTQPIAISKNITIFVYQSLTLVGSRLIVLKF